MTSPLNPNRGLDLSYLTPAYIRRQARVDARRDARIAALIEDARARGMVALKCEACGCTHGLGVIGSSCNGASPDVDGEACGSYNLREVKAEPVEYGGNPGDELVVVRGGMGWL